MESEVVRKQEMNVSDITDTLTFTACFKDGTSEQIHVNISFDDDGIMHAVASR